VGARPSVRRPLLEQRSRDLPSDQLDHIDGLLPTAISRDSGSMDGALLAKRLLLTESAAYRSGLRS
jgi:hypothetical protein